MTNKERRAKAKAAGICYQCNSSRATPGLTKCEDCRAAESAKQSSRRTPAPLRKSRFTREDAAHMRAMNRAGQSQAFIALRFECAQSSVCRLINEGA